jgi:transposase-like protein
MRKERKHFTPEEKVAILRRHLVDKVPVSELCEGLGLRVRLNSATGYITPKDILAGRQHEIHAERDRKLEAARQQRQSHRQQVA